MPFFYHFLYIVSSFLTLSLAVGFYLKEPKSPVIKAFSAIGLIVAGWIMSLYIFYTSTDQVTVLTAGRLTYVFAALIAFFLFDFIRHFPTKSYAMPRLLRTLVIFETLALCVVTYATSLVDEYEVIVGVGRHTVFGPLYWWFVAHFVSLTIATLAIFVHKYRHLTSPSRVQLLNLAIGWGAGVTIGITTNIILPWLGGNFSYEHLGNFSALAFVGAATYATARNELFNMKILTVETLVVLVSTIMLVAAAVAPPGGIQVVMFAAFALTLALGAYLVYSVRKEVVGREKLDVANAELSAANAQLKEMDHIKNEFITMASHQLRTPITVVKGYLSLMMEGAYGAVPEAFKDKLRQMFSLNERLVQMIDNMLNVARIEKRKIEYNVVRVDILATVRTIVDEMRIKATDKGLSLKATLPDHPVIAFIDEEKFGEVIGNLIDNAVKYTDKGDVEVTVRDDSGEGFASVLVKDSGIGMSPEESSRVFTKFFRAKEAVIREPGTGLGLFICNKFMTGMGGEIRVDETATGHGTTFVVHLPTRQRDPDMPLV